MSIRWKQFTYLSSLLPQHRSSPSSVQQSSHKRSLWPSKLEWAISKRSIWPSKLEWAISTLQRFFQGSLYPALPRVNPLESWHTVHPPTALQTLSKCSFYIVAYETGSLCERRSSLSHTCHALALISTGMFPSHPEP